MDCALACPELFAELAVAPEEVSFVTALAWVTTDAAETAGGATLADTGAAGAGARIGVGCAAAGACAAGVDARTEAATDDGGGAAACGGVPCGAVAWSGTADGGLGCTGGDVTCEVVFCTGEFWAAGAGSAGVTR